MIRIIIIVLLVSYLSGYAQNSSNKHDFVWIMGTPETDTNIYSGGIQIDFNIPPPYISDTPCNIHLMNTNASICDSLGNLLFYTNGFKIMNANYQQMQNGSGLNPGTMADEYTALGIGMIISQACLILPYPNHSNLYVVLHETMNNYPTDLLCYEIYYSIVDMSANDGLGAVTVKNQLLLPDTLSLGGLTAVRHGNGRDWWIILAEYGANCNYVLKLTPDGFIIDSKQCLGSSNDSAFAQVVFSPNGTKFIRSENPVIKIFDFDRCAGLLNNPVEFSMDETPNTYPFGLSVSPNSRYMYTFNILEAYQFDLNETNIASSKTLIGTYDGHLSPIPSTFAKAQLAPDGKIYVVCGNASTVLHVVNYPDEAYPTCDFVQHSIELPNYNNFSIPNLPNYRLGALPPERCAWAVGVETVAPQSQTKEVFSIYPNPATNQLHITSTIPATFILYDLLGRAVRQAGLGSGTVQVSVLGLPAGTYLYQIINPQKQILQQGKLNIVH